MSHNGFAHVLLGAGLFIINSLIFKGAGTWTAILVLSAQATGNLMSAGSGDLAGATARAYGLVPIIISVIANIVIYYALAAIIIFIFNLFFKR